MRETGYYWVKININIDWMTAYWDTEEKTWSFKRDGIEKFTEFHFSDFQYVGETRILNPDEN